MDFKQLISIAFEIRENAYAPYSGFKSGAALLSDTGNVYVGCNMEIASFTPSVSAEHSAFINAISNGEKRFTAIAIVGGSEGEELNFCPPSGVGRQVMQEFCQGSNFKIILAKSLSECVIYNFEDLFPVSFGKKNVIG